MPVPKENTITKSGSTTEMLRFRNASDTLSCMERCLLTWSRDGANTQLWNNHFLLYYFVLTFDESCIGPVMFPTLSMWNGPKSDVCFLLFFFCFTSFCSFFILILSRIFFLFCFVQALEIYKIHSVFMLTAHISPNSKRLLGGLFLSLSQTKWHHKDYCTYFVYVRCLNKLWKVLK